MQKNLKSDGKYLYVLLVIIEDKHMQYISRDGNKLLAKAKEAQEIIAEGNSKGHLRGYCYVGMRAVDLNDAAHRVTEPNPITEFVEGSEEEEEDKVIDMTEFFEEKRKLNAAKPPIGE